MHNTLSASPSDRLALFPDSTSILDDTLSIAGQALSALADRYGTPLYIYDRATLETSVAEYQSSLRKHYPAPARLTYAGKAFLCKALAQWTQTHDLLVDCSGEGEITMALAGGVPHRNILVHGVNKSAADLQATLRYAGTMVVDNLSELQRLITLFPISHSLFPNLWLRLLPGIALTTHHAHTQTGQQGSKFGMTREEILQAVQMSKSANRQISKAVNGIHFHLGSNFRDPEPLLPAIDMALDLAKEIGFSGEWHFCPGGGWGVAYHEDELPNPEIESYVHGVSEAVAAGCHQRGLDLPHLHLEPGRSLIARAGVAIYRVGAVKRRGERTWLLVDGGMADNPRYALYGAKYSCLTVTGPGRERTGKVSVGGPYCESGDVIIEDLPMPEVREGELIAVPVAGAYHMSMSSNYNGACRPAVVWLEAGTARLIVQRETKADLLKNQM